MSESSSETPVKLTLKRREKLVEIDDVRYTLREMTGSELDAWRTSLGGRISVDAKGATKVTNFDKFTSSLIAKCLYDADDKKVPEPVIAQWPATTQKALFDLCQTLNGLDDEGADAAKKD